MRKFLKCWQRLPAKVLACTNLTLICLCCLVIYIAIGSPSFSARHAFRRAEKAELVGPSNILAHIRPDGTAYRHLILGDDGNGVILFAYNRWNSDATDLLYVEKTGDLTIAAAPGRTFFATKNGACVPVILFDSESGAIRAELDLTLAAEYEGEQCQNTYHLKADRRYNGCFIFTLQTSSMENLGAEGQMLFTLQSITGNSMADTQDMKIPATVRLFDEANNLIREEILFIQSAAAKAHTEQNSSP